MGLTDSATNHGALRRPRGPEGAGITEPQDRDTQDRVFLSPAQLSTPLPAARAGGGRVSLSTRGLRGP